MPLSNELEFDRPLHTPADDPAQASSAIQHFHDKLLHIRDHLKTGPGQTMAVKRHQFVSRVHRCYAMLCECRNVIFTQMLDFLNATEEEYGA